MTRAPQVLVTTRHDLRRGKSIQFVGGLHLGLLLDDGVAPVPVLAVEGMEEHLAEMVAHADGLLITEGGDLGPDLRPFAAGEETERDELDPVKDRIEARLVRDALARDLPILGICRGMELINTLLGGELYGDLPTELGTQTCHLSADDYHGHRHPVEIADGSPLGGIYAQKTVSVSSYHHQGIRTLAPELETMAIAPDGLIEAFHHPGHAFVWGLQFHPERQLHDNAAHRQVHARFAAAAHAHADARA